MATKAELEQRVKDLTLVLEAVQNQRDEGQEALREVRGALAQKSRKIEMLEDQVEQDAQKIESLENKIEEQTDTVFDDGELDQLRRDKERLLAICGLTEVEWSRDHANSLEVEALNRIRKAV